MKYFLRALPVIMFPFIMNFPAVDSKILLRISTCTFDFLLLIQALTLYWLSANVITGGQVALFKIPQVRDFFQIEARRNFEPDQMEVLDSNKKKGFRQSATEGKMGTTDQIIDLFFYYFKLILLAWNNMKIVNELEERKKFSELKFKQAGLSPVQKTYKYDPTKQTAEQIAKRIRGPKRPQIVRIIQINSHL